LRDRRHKRVPTVTIVCGATTEHRGQAQRSITAWEIATLKRLRATKSAIEPSGIEYHRRPVLIGAKR
jgi:hypothetical protein